MAGSMDAQTDAMTRFVSDLKNPNSKAAPAAECLAPASSLSATLQASTDNLMSKGGEFLKQADQGFTSYKDITTACCNHYLQNDQVGAAQLAATMHQTPAEGGTPPPATASQA